ncbi:ornithine cyclodeaminase family protein [Rubinisphaera sp. JC750]|uniref:ornithine cyclodeaminase family protein n=1 Tax=Rubinisphaera sp. JC750 TaxID=2898658 RepID=UPI001F1C76AE|nr:ornithine cyclodeaminase family protein [Rubinisphaera sp. JC750]
MPATFLSEDVVRSLLTMSDAIEVTERAFAHIDNGHGEIIPRRRVRTDMVMLHSLAGADRQLGQLGWKLYTTTREGAKFLVGLYDGHQGDLIGLLEADYLGQLRTGAASGVASKYLANPQARTLGVIGTGLQARTQVWAIEEACTLDRILVFGRNAERRAEFARQLSEDLDMEVLPAESADAVAEQADILVTATTSKTPVFDGKLLKEGVHINAVGSNFLRKSELDIETFRVADLVVCDSREQCRLEAGDFVEPIQQGLLSWDDIPELGEVVNGRVQRENADQITIFKSVGLGLQDVALGMVALERARETGQGQPLPF